MKLRGFGRRPFRLLLAAMPALLHMGLGAQSPSDTLPERVVDRFYDAINRCDTTALGKLFGPVVYHTALEDTAAAPRRMDRSEFIHSIAEWCHPPRPRFKMLRRIVHGPYVLDEQAVIDKGAAHLDLFRVRNGKIVHEWEGGWKEGD